uniref:Uncharacterized protein n=1 Tax=Cannabis sativa TaxID=3483 RepID=A0A803QHT8_CANSA
MPRPNPSPAATSPTFSLRHEADEDRRQKITSRRQLRGDHYSHQCPLGFQSSLVQYCWLKDVAGSNPFLAKFADKDLLHHNVTTTLKLH